MTVPAHPSLQPHQLSDGRGLHHKLLVATEKQAEASQVGVLVVWQLLLVEKLRHHGLHLSEDRREEARLNQAWGQAHPYGAFPPPSPSSGLPCSWCSGGAEEPGDFLPLPSGSAWEVGASPSLLSRAPSSMTAFFGSLLPSTCYVPHISDPFLHFLLKACPWKHCLLPFYR